MEKKPQNSSYVQLEGVRLYGESAGILSRAELSNVETPLSAVLHVIRHFTNVSPETKSSLTGQSFEDDGKVVTVDDSFLQKQIAALGSKFNAKITDPEKLIQACIENVSRELDHGANFIWIKDPHTPEDEVYIKLDADKTLKNDLGLADSDAFGNTTVVEITEKYKPHVKKEQRGKGEAKDRIEVNVLEGIKAPETDTFMFRLKRNSSGETPRIYTIYTTDFITPSLPRRESQSDEEYEYNKAWWDSHAFIK